MMSINLKTLKIQQNIPKPSSYQNPSPEFSVGFSTRAPRRTDRRRECRRPAQKRAARPATVSCALNHGVCHNPVKQPEKIGETLNIPESPRDNTWHFLGLILSCNKVLMVDPEPELEA